MIVEPAAGDRVEDNLNPVGRAYYSFSTLLCTPASLSPDVALALGALAVLVLAVDYGRPPWLALTLAFSFASYGLIKKRVGIAAMESLGVETAVLALPAAAYLGWLAVTNGSTFGSHGAGHALLMASAGVVTAVPLLLFGAAAGRLPLSTLGLMQYLTPVLQFGFGVLLFHEPMPAARLAEVDSE